MASKTLWDLPTQLIHWSLATAVILNLFILEEGDEVHQWSGYTACGIVLFRFVWGFLGSTHSRFSKLPLHPKEVVRFLGGFFQKDPPVYTGHNPIASYVYLLIWGSILSLGVTGWMMGTDAYWGEEWLEELHGNITVFLQILILLHFIGMIIDSIRYKRQTWLSMFRGWR